MAGAYGCFADSKNIVAKSCDQSTQVSVAQEAVVVRPADSSSSVAPAPSFSDAQSQNLATNPSDCAVCDYCGTSISYELCPLFCVSQKEDQILFFCSRKCSSSHQV